MKSTAFILAGCALLALPIGSAAAGQCTGEIDNIAKFLAAHDAGAGPTPGAAGSSRGQHPPTIAMDQADQGRRASETAAQSTKPQHPPTDVMTRETTGMSSPSSGAEPRKEEHPPTAVMNRETQGQISHSHTMAAAMAALERARMLDQHGKEAECLSAVGQAKLLSGLR
jgi:hypothetical protein